MKNRILTRLLCLLLLHLSLSNASRAAIEPIPTGSFIVNMGITPQTYGNGLKPWGMIHDLIKNYKVQIKWVINPAKAKDGIDFVYNSTAYRGGTFIIPLKYRTAAVNARITYWQTQGVIGVTTTTGFSIDVTYNLKYSPRWTFDFQNGAIAHGFLEEAGIPTAPYPMKFPTELDVCNDLFVMPHADPTWATHSNLFSWNQNSRGWIWAGCHAVSVLENLFNPGNPTEKMNFLSQNGLVPFGSHSNGSPPYSYRFPTDPEMQFMGIADNAMQNGSEQIFLPATNTWRPTTQVAVYDPTQSNVPALSPGEAAAIVYGRAFGNDSRGKVLYTGGHNIERGHADATSAIRVFFNFSFLSIYDKVIQLTLFGQINLISLNNYNYRASLPVGTTGNYTFQWTSSCGGTFSNPTDSVTLFTAPEVTVDCIDCRLICTVTDSCGREYYEEIDVTICPSNTLGVNLLSFTGAKSGDHNLLQWKTAAGVINTRFELEYSIDGSSYLKLATIPANGNNTEPNEYSYLHQQVGRRSGWYRLKIFDQDENAKYSDIVLVKRDELKYIVYPAYPNPFENKMTVSIESEANVTVELYLADLSGKIVRNLTVNLRKGENKIELNQLDMLSPGVYILRIKNDETINSMRLLKPGNR